MITFKQFLQHLKYKAEPLDISLFELIYTQFLVMRFVYQTGLGMTWCLLLVECVVRSMHFVQISFFSYCSVGIKMSCNGWEGSMVFMSSCFPH